MRAPRLHPSRARLPRFPATLVATLAAAVCAASGLGCDETRATAAPAGSPPEASSPTSRVAVVTASATVSASGGAPTAPAAASVQEPVPSASARPEGPCPPEMAAIGRFCIDRWEAHLVDVTEGPPRLHPHHQRPAEGRRYEARSGPGVWPQGYVNRHEAAAACEAAGKRLCRWIEWRRACQGPGWFRYPYGNGGKNRTCNTGKDHLMTRFFGADPRAWKEDDFNDPRLLQEPGYLAKTGSFQGCVSPDGVHDMYGNLHEWVSDSVSTALMHKLEGEGVRRQKQPWKPGNALFLGGFFSTLGEHGPGCHFTTAAHGAVFHDYSTGFRCCADASPEAGR